MVLNIRSSSKRYKCKWIILLSFNAKIGAVLVVTKPPTFLSRWSFLKFRNYIEGSWNFPAILWWMRSSCSSGQILESDPPLHPPSLKRHLLVYLGQDILILFKAEPRESFGLSVIGIYSIQYLTIPLCIGKGLGVDNAHSNGCRQQFIVVSLRIFTTYKPIQNNGSSLSWELRHTWRSQK